ncbi:MAG: glycosyltransferase [Clostridiales bacterium]|nr:glycosyltransferase [Clostridiales bacterium]
MAKVSVIVPIYNVQAYLREALDSLVNQTLKDMEIICVNDGSTDGSLDIIREYEAKDNRIVVITGPNGGYGKGMNKGLNRATGEYVGILEPDDYVEENMFEELYAIAHENDLDFVKSDFYRFTRTPEGKEEREYVSIDVTKKNYRQLFDPGREPDRIRYTLNTWTGIYRRAFLNEHHIRHHETPGASFQDNGFFWQTFVLAGRAMIVDHAYYCNRRDNPNSSVKSREKVYCMNIEYDWIRDFLMEDRERWERFQNMYWWKKYFVYGFTLGRIGQEYKKEYLARMQAEYARAMQKGEMSPDVFTELEWTKIQALIRNSGSFYDMFRSVKVFRKLLPYVPQSVKCMIMKAMSWRKK